jgi:hypothetical protein
MGREEENDDGQRLKVGVWRSTAIRVKEKRMLKKGCGRVDEEQRGQQREAAGRVVVKGGRRGNADENE